LPVVVLGDTGTGKEHLARLIHAQDRVKPLKKGIRQYVVDFDKSFVPVLVSAIGQGVMEGEIFGIKNLQGNPPVNGYIRDAQTGTLFFDELADIPIGIQGKLLRFLQNQEVRPIGGEWEKVEDVRVVFATHSEERLHDRSRFREDFVQRIDGLAFRLPPLSERAQEHQLLIDHFFARELKRQERVLKRSEKGGVAIGRERLPDDLAPMLEDLIAPEVNARLLQMCADGDFTGNVRQLDHFIRRLVRVAKPGSPITGRHLQTAAEYSLLRPGAKPAAFRSSKNLDPDGHPLANVFNGMGWNDFVAGERWTKGRMMYDAESRGFKPREIVAYLFEREIALRGTDVQLRDASGNPVQGDPGEESGRQALISMLVGQYQRNKKNWVPAYRSQTELAGASS
jgi:DNA-binding NtrC family response regulator